MNTDMSEEAMRTYRSSAVEPNDLDGFWAETLADARRRADAPVATEVQTPLTSIRTWDVAFSGWGGQRIRGWLRAPDGAGGPLPVVVEYIGYGGGRGSVLQNLVPASAGLAHLVMDTRGQGSLWSRGDTPDDAWSGPAAPGFMTRGIEAPETYYYTRLITDAVLAVDAVRELPCVDPARVGVTGGSQGGALALAAGALAEDVLAVAARVPFLCDIARAITITDTDPFKEVARYLAVQHDRVERALHTLSYVDGVHLAARGTAPLMMTTALMDDIVPPSTAFAAYNAYRGPKSMHVWPYGGHDGGGTADDMAMLDFWARTIAL